MSTKRLAVVCNYVLRPDRIGGMDRFFVAYDKAAKAKGYEVDWFFPDVLDKTFYEGVTVFSAEGNSSVEAFFLNYLEENGKMYSTLVTHFTELCTPFYKKAKHAGRIKNLIAVDHNPRPLNGFPLKKQLKNRLKGYLHHKAIDRFIGVSSYTARHIVKDLGKVVVRKTGVIYNGIDTSVFKKRAQHDLDSQGNVHFVVVSHLRESKGLQDLIDALALLKPDLQNNLHITIYGEGPLEEGLKQQAKDKAVDQLLTFKGSSSEIPTILADYEYLIQPTYMECFSLSILESLSANVPVITTTVGGNPEIIKEGENGFLFRPKDKNALANIISEVVTGQRGINRDTSLLIEKDYSLDRMVAEHINLLD
ncbi:glycosyltransferase family 4 protein [Leeuwenhoekiella marinoflava]|uniref:Glycosyltransferase involved in cell wall biosynthesis n=2 Tax=Leeuwenhoekiella marinoflava TaxID=988 RepID=A0A4Q0PIL5_9FLAO|nr:glycosyltransferase family 4 protein [Leeuwenhoekiella marinoflava]RXG26995.1 glycosyltransferase involved in cell wall biosynthesis [Leeuwenhoekiella marinoflava]SHF41456.1 Glycosyltransferase involved in cell wall bisynthesis [Leeuwenhoekiella marinoflava DSM 3653]